jgi:ferrous iron transport protein B
MRLSELKTGEEGSIIQVRGRGAFRRRIMEMGFVNGEKIKVIKNAPLKDPIEYSLMGYRVSLRRSEADLIEVGDNSNLLYRRNSGNGSHYTLTEKQVGTRKGKSIHVAFVGNPNAGKTTLFNYASNSNEHTGNYSGVTIDSKTAKINQDGYQFVITDLPGTYSVSAFSPEELYVRDFIIDNLPDVVVNVVDASNLERNLYLTTQLIDMDIKVVLAFNMYDELEKRQDKLDFVMLGKLLGIPVIPTVGSKGRGITELMQKVILVFNDKEPVQRHIHINYGEELERSIYKIQQLIKIPDNYAITDRISSRFIALKMLEHDRHIEPYIQNSPNFQKINEVCRTERARIESIFAEDAVSIITKEKYGFISGALKETYSRGLFNATHATDILDGLLTHKIFGFPFFLLFMWVMFYTTFKLGTYPQQWLELCIGFLGHSISHILPDGSLKDLLIDGIIGGVGGVIVFLPNILILFLFISFMEDSGYMARAVFIMDKLMHKIGLHGKSFIPLIIGFGCNVPAIMATRSIEDKNNRLLTMLINPFMSCSARLPVYLLLIGAIFPNNQGSLLFMLYALGILLAIAVALLFKHTLFKAEGTPFVMELPPYRVPTLRSTIRHMWFKGSQYLKKMGGVILIASVLLWALGYFPRKIDNPDIANIVNITSEKKISGENQKNIKSENSVFAIDYESIRLESSYIGRIGKFIVPVIEPLGFDWKMGVSLISGIAAKEVVVSTLGVLHQVNTKEGKKEISLTNKLKNEVHPSGKYKGKEVYSPLATISFLLFILIYFPCIAVFAAVKKESGNLWWAVFMVFYTTALAYLVSLLFFQTGMLIAGI